MIFVGNRNKLFQMETSNIYRMLKRIIWKFTKNIFLILIIIFQKIIHIFFHVDDYKVFYLPVNLKKSGNAYFLLNEWLKKNEYNHFYMINDKKKLNSNFSNVLFLTFGIKSIYHYSTSKYIVRESEFNSIGLLSRKDSIYIQLWHAAGAFKKMAMDIEKRSTFIKISRKKDIASWSLLLCSSPFLVNIYSKAFDGFDFDKIFVSGLPRNDYLYRLVDRKERIRGKYDMPSDKKIILYAPTFRDKASTNDDSVILNTISFLSENLPVGLSLAVRLHPSMVDRLPFDSGVINLNICDVEEALVVADILITDYSSIIFDYSLLEKPMIFYVPDYDKYYDRRGFYFEYNEFVPGPIYKNYTDLLDGILNFKACEWENKIIDFKEKYNPFFDGKNSQRVLDKILTLLDK